MSARISIDGISISGDHFVEGRRVASSETFEDRSPLDWKRKLANVSKGDKEIANKAVAAAEGAFEAWAERSFVERAGYMNRLAELIDSNVKTIAHIECLDMAMLLDSLQERVIPRAARNFRVYSKMAQDYEERCWESNGTQNRVTRMPAGPAVVVTPWNAPFMLSSWKCAPALAAGNTVILKPAEWSPLSASLLSDFIEEAGFPPGVFNIVQGFGDEVGAALVNDSRVRRISFTGSTETARYIGSAAAKNIVPFTAELGGKSPLLVFGDADIDLAARKAAGQFDDSGQVCMAGTRILVEESLKGEFLALLNQYTDRHVLGDSRDSATTISPLIHPDHLFRVKGYVERALDEGNKVHRGGHIYTEEGLWYEPTIIEPVSNSCEIVQKEVFGPVLTIQSFKNEREAIELANSTAYGLAGMIFTRSAARAERVGRAVRAGTVWVNCFLIRDLTAPFGGMGISGIGREGGNYALDFHSDLKTLQILDGSVRY